MTIRDIMVSFGFEVDKSSEREVENGIKSLKNMAGKLLGGIAVVFSVSGLKSFASECVQAASSVQEMENKFDVVFDSLRDEVDQWAEEFADAVGRNKNSIKTYLADQQNLLVGFGMTRAEGAKLSEEMTALALDIASFANQDEDVAVNAMTKAVMGESEAAKTLGAVLNDVTRAETMAAMGLSGKYSSLDQLTKMQVNYNTILRQSPDAVGDCIRSMDSYEARQRQLNAATAEFKEFIGGQLIPVFAAFTGWITQGVKAATKFARAIFLDKEENNRLLKVFERTQAVVKKLQPSMERFAKSTKDGISRAVEVVKAIADRLGGMENLFKVLVSVAGAFFIAINWNKLIGSAKTFVSMLSGIGKAFTTANVSILAVVAVIAVLFLIVEDFVQFLLGNDSLIGSVFDKAGVGADNARKAICKAWETVRDFLLGVWEFIRQAAGMFADTVGGFFERHSDSIRKNFERTWGLIRTFLKGVWTFLSQLAGALFGSVEGSINGSAQSTKDRLLEVWQSALHMLSAIWDAMYGNVSAVFHAMAAVIETVFRWIRVFWDSWGPEILAWFKALWDSVGGILNAFLDIAKGVADFISSVFAGDWQGAWDAVKQIFTGVWNVILSVAAAVLETIRLLFGMALSAIRAVWNAAWGAVYSFFRGIWNGIVSFLRSIWETVAQLFSAALGTVKAVWEAAWSAIQGFFLAVWGGIASFLQTVWAVITRIISRAVNNSYDVIVSVLTAIWGFFGSIFSSIASLTDSTFSNILNGIINTVTDIKDAIMDGFNAAIDWIKGLPAQAVKWGADFIGGLRDGILSGINGVVDAVKGVGEKIRSFLHFSVPDEGPLTDYEGWMPDFMQGLSSGIQDSSDVVSKAVAEVSESIREQFKDVFAQPEAVPAAIERTAAANRQGEVLPAAMETADGIVEDGAGMTVEMFKRLLSQSLQCGADFISVMNGGIMSGLDGMTGAVKDAGEQIRSFLHISAPDEGTLADGGGWAPDFRQEPASGTGEEESTVLDKIKALTEGMAVLTQAASARAATAANSTINNTSSSMTQNVSIANSYSGGSAETQRNVSKAMKKSAEDATAYMARGLAYARG